MTKEPEPAPEVLSQVVPEPQVQSTEVKLEDLIRPEPVIKINFAGVDKDIFMSAGLRTRLVLHLQNFNDIQDIYVSPVLQEAVLMEALSIRDKRGEITEEVNLDELSPEESEKLVTWIVDHVVYFFTRGALSTKSLMSQGSQGEKLVQLLIGSQPLLENKPSAGPSVVPPAT